MTDAATTLSLSKGHSTIRRVNSLGTFSGNLFMRYYSATTKPSALYLAYNGENMFNSDNPARVSFNNAKVLDNVF